MKLFYLCSCAVTSALLSFIALLLALLFFKRPYNKVIRNIHFLTW